MGAESIDKTATVPRYECDRLMTNHKNAIETLQSDVRQIKVDLSVLATIKADVASLKTFAGWITFAACGTFILLMIMLFFYFARLWHILP